MVVSYYQPPRLTPLPKRPVYIFWNLLVRQAVKIVIGVWSSENKRSTVVKYQIKANAKLVEIRKDNLKMLDEECLSSRLTTFNS